MQSKKSTSEKEMSDAKSTETEIQAEKPKPVKEAKTKVKEKPEKPKAKTATKSKPKTAPKTAPKTGAKSKPKTAPKTVKKPEKKAKKPEKTETAAPVAEDTTPQGTEVAPKSDVVFGEVDEHGEMSLVMGETELKAHANMRILRMTEEDLKQLEKALHSAEQTRIRQKKKVEKPKNPGEKRGRRPIDPAQLHVLHRSQEVCIVEVTESHYPQLDQALKSAHDTRMRNRTRQKQRSEGENRGRKLIDPPTSIETIRRADVSV